MDKRKKLKRQVSTDGGFTWQDMIPYEYIAGELIQRDSPDCNKIEWRTVSGYICEENTTEMTQWVADTGYVCVGFDKYNKEKEQVSYNSGISWADTGNTRAGSTLIEQNSTDCGYVPPITRWVADTGYVCVGYDKYNKEKEQISYDSGSTWGDTGNTRAGSTLIEANSADCGYDPHDYSTDYLTTEALGSGNISLKKGGTNSSSKEPITNIQYSKNNGAWTAYTYDTNVSVVTGDKIRWKATIKDGNYYNYYSCFAATADYKVYGNPLSLLNNDGFVDEPGAIYNYAYTALFIYNSKLKDISGLALPATTLADYCYDRMFDGCTSLTTAPALPATTLSNYCYIAMFLNCTSLTTAPVLPARRLYEGCYNSMFEGCTSLTTAPALPATTLAKSCYSDMFQDCTNLTTAPALPATTLAERCYYYMFLNCTSLTTAPELPATTLTSLCYYYMFAGCTSLNYIKCCATDISASGCTTVWTEGVAATGTFVKNASMSSWTTGENGIPSGWTVDNCDCGYSPTPQYEIAPLHYIENDVLKPIANSSAILNDNVITLHVEGLIPEVIEAGATYVIYVSAVATVEVAGRGYLTIDRQSAQNQNPVTNETITINSFSNVKGGEWIKFVKMIEASPQYGPGRTGESCVIPIIFYLHLGENISDTYLSDVYISPEKTTEVELRLSPGMSTAEGMYLFNDALGRDNTIYTITLDLIPTENNGGVYYYPSLGISPAAQFMTTDDFLNYLNDSSVTCHFWTETNHYPEIASVISKTSISNKVSLKIKFNKLVLDSFMEFYWHTSCRMILCFNINDEKFVQIDCLVVKNVINNTYKKGLIGNSRYTLLSVNEIYSVDKSFNRIANTGHENDIYDETYTDRTDFTVKEIVSVDDVTRKNSKTIIYNGVEFVDKDNVIIEKGINNVYDYFYDDGGKYMLYQIISDTPRLSNSKFGLGTKIKTGGPLMNFASSFGEYEFVYDGYVLNNTFSEGCFKSANLELITYSDSYYSILRNYYYVNPLMFSNHGNIHIPYYSDFNNTRYYYPVQTQFLGKGTMHGGWATIEV